MRKKKRAGERREMTRRRGERVFSWRKVELCLCCGCVGLWHDDLGRKIKITLPGITTLLQCSLLLLDLDEVTFLFVSACLVLFKQTREEFFFKAASLSAGSRHKKVF